MSPSMNKSAYGLQEYQIRYLRDANKDLGSWLGECYIHIQDKCINIENLVVVKYVRNELGVLRYDPLFTTISSYYPLSIRWHNGIFGISVQAMVVTLDQVFLVGEPSNVPLYKVVSSVSTVWDCIVPDDWVHAPDCRQQYQSGRRRQVRKQH
jgi:hypothetical protein